VSGVSAFEMLVIFFHFGLFKGVNMGMIRLLLSMCLIYVCICIRNMFILMFNVVMSMSVMMFMAHSDFTVVHFM
jgi:hypothetical protein